MTRERLIFIDYCKAIAIVLVFLGHSKSAIGGECQDIIYAFHMPLFFFVSGFLFKKMSWREQLCKLRDGLIIPSLFFILFSYITLYVPRNIYHCNYTDMWSFLEVFVLVPVKDVVRGLSVCDNGSIWFVFSLLLSTLTVRVIPDKVIAWCYNHFLIFLFFVPLLGSVWGYFFPKELPWNFQRYYIICIYFLLGNICSQYYVAHKEEYCRINIFYQILFVALGVLLFLFVHPILRWHNYSASIWLSYQTFFLSLVGIVGSLFVSLYLSLQIGRNKIVEFLSNNTFTLFATEVVWGWNLHRLELVTSMVMSPFLKVILQFVMGGAFAYLLNRFTPVLIGKKKS